MRCSQTEPYSIPSLARASSISGTVRPSVLALFRLVPHHVGPSGLPFDPSCARAHREARQPGRAEIQITCRGECRWCRTNIKIAHRSPPLPSSVSAERMAWTAIAAMRPVLRSGGDFDYRTERTGQRINGRLGVLAEHVPLPKPARIVVG
jgi:hypothetical protein